MNILAANFPNASRGCSEYAEECVASFQQSQLMKKRKSNRPAQPDRRSFLLGVGAVAATATTSALPDQSSSRKVPPVPLLNILRVPDRVSVFGGARSGEYNLTRAGSNWQASGIEVATEVRQEKSGEEVAIFVSAPKISLTRIRLRWHGAFPLDWRYLGDRWERSYGDLEFRGLAGDRLMPWYFLATDGHATNACGVKTGSAAICYWQVDAAGVTLWLDVRNGGSGVLFGNRRLHAATVIQRYAYPGEPPTEAAKDFCGKMCDRPLLPASPVYGSNNWYYMYGNNTSAERSLRDAQLLAELVPSDITNRPFCVIDMGWHAAKEGAGPASQTSKTYPDMPGLAKKMRALGVRPGIWTRPTLTADVKAAAWRLPPAGGRPQGELIVMDPTIPEALEYMAENVHVLRKWEFQLIKHDFSTFDLLGRWGFEMGPGLTDEGWHFHDQSLTTAEVISNLYRAIREAAGDATLIGCNTIGHLAAGLVQVQRIGDDTSGREWARTRKMGVNTLGFRLPQHNTFFAADADCVPLTNDIPWELTRQWLDLVARSGTALFVSVDPDVLQPSQKPQLQAALRAAAQKRESGAPVDWLETTTPQSWRLDGKPTQFDWYLDD
jgi:alpha-galactosidase